jgi:allantoin racemase
MRIWHQSMTVLDNLPGYEERLRSHSKKVLLPDTEVVMHGLRKDTYSSDYPGVDIAHRALFTLHSMQWFGFVWQAQQEGFDGFAVCTTIDPFLNELKTLVDIPVVGCAEATYLTIPTLGERFGLVLFNELLAPAYVEQIRSYKLLEHFVGVEASGLDFSKVLEGYRNPKNAIASFTTAAQKLIDRGAQVIIPGEMPLNLLLASEGIDRIEGVPIIDSLGLTLCTTQMRVQLKQSSNLAPNEKGWNHSKPNARRLEEVLRYYGHI